MSESINWTVDKTQIEGIPEPQTPSNGGITGSVADIILSGFMNILNYFDKHVLDPDSHALAQLKLLSNDLNKLKTLFNELTSSSSLDPSWGTNVNKVISDMKTIINGLPPGELQTQLLTSLNGVQDFLKSPLKQQFAQWIKDLQTFQTTWNNMLNATSWQDSLENDFSNDLTALQGDQTAMQSILNALPQSSPLYGIFQNALGQFNNFWTNLMDIEAGNDFIHKSLYDVWPSDDNHFWHESLKHWMQALMHVEGQYSGGNGNYGWKVHQFDNFQYGGYLPNIISEYQGEQDTPVSTQTLGQLISQMAQDQDPFDQNSLYVQLSSVWNSFQQAVTSISNGISAAQSLNQQFVVDVNSDMTQYNAIVQLFVQEIAIPQRVVDLAITRIR